MYIVMYVNHGYIVKREVYDIQEKARKVAAEYNRKPNLERLDCSPGYQGNVKERRRAMYYFTSEYSMQTLSRREIRLVGIL